MVVATDPWWQSELAGCTVADARLSQRLQKIVERMGSAIGASLPLACQDWASTKAAYRFPSNERVSKGEILAGHIGATRERTAAAARALLVLQDTTEFTYQRERPRGDWHHIQCEQWEGQSGSSANAHGLRVADAFFARGHD